jgi:hypothetical protein
VVGILGDDAYGNAIVKEIKQQLSRVVSLASAHVTLYRLQDKGYVKSMLGEQPISVAVEANGSLK